MIVVRVVVGVAVAVATTAISLRLLGIRRGWGKALLSGAVGWGTAVVFALGLEHWDWGANGLIVVR